MSALFAPFDDARVLAHDALLVVDKPAGIPSQSPRGEGDGLVERLKAHFGLDYLGVHQRLDAGTSGCIGYATGEAGNTLFQAGATEKRYLAAVRLGKPRALSDEWRVIEHALRVRDGGAEVVTGRGARAKGVKHARARMRSVARHGDRALVEAVLETGRTHQLRVQLADLGLPIGGDVRYGGPPAERLMLHASSLRIGERRFESAMPKAFERFLRGDDGLHAAALPEVVGQAAHRRYALHHAETPTAYRLLLGDAEGAPGVNLDVYGDHLVLHLVSEEAHAAEDAIVSALHAAFARAFAGLYVKRRPKQANALRQAERREAAPSTPLWGEGREAFFVNEAELAFEVNLGEALSTGIFLDQRRSRERVCEMASGARVLNLFAYSCGFGLAAAVGGAAEVVNVDASGVALGRGKRNFDHAGVQGRFIKDDVFEFLAREHRRGRRYDLIVCDPPTYARGKKRRWKSGSGWRELTADCLRVAAPGATLFLSSNDARMAPDAFRRFIHEGARAVEREVISLRDGARQRDFPYAGPPLPHKLWLALA
ncbi:MAG: class I SAM-dependent methyltransferase [Myxococcota bacterium]